MNIPCAADKGKTVQGLQLLSNKCKSKEASTAIKKAEVKQTESICIQIAETQFTRLR